jgi:PAS domain S-box-containing protein
VVASSTSNLVVITDAAGRIDWVNPAFELRTGYSLDEVRGRKPGSFLQGAGTDPEAVERLRAAIHELRPATEELLNYTKSGEPYWISLNLTPVLDVEGRIERFISVQADTTERKRVERMKTQFVSTVSHELRTPLTAISGALGLLSGGVAGPLPEKAAGLLEIAQRNGERLTLLINDLLDMEKLVEGGILMESEVQQLMPIVELAVNENQTYADKYGMRLCLGQRCDDVLVHVDSLRLMQVMSNLLSNACKFAPAGTSVDVGDATARICVSDRGPGIPESFREIIFEKFSRADSSDTRASGGTGLGLAISKELVERMGGTIGYESDEGRGATFFVDLPIASAHQLHGGEHVAHAGGHDRHADVRQQ